MRAGRVGVLIVTLGLLAAAGWWLFVDQGALPQGERGSSFERPADRQGKPRFQPRTASYAPLPAGAQAAEPDTETVQQVYPEGQLIRCAADGLEDGPYRASAPELRHLRIRDGALSGVLTRPGEGAGFLLSPRGHQEAELTWSEEGCQLAPLRPLTLSGRVVDEAGELVPGMELVGCVGEVMASGPDGSFEMSIHAGQSCWPFAFRDDAEGFAKGSMTEVIGGETRSVELLSPGPAMPAAQQIQRLEQGALQLLGLLEKQHAEQSPLTEALQDDPDSPVLRAWADYEDEQLNLRYEEVEFLLSGEATEEDWRDIWLFGFGM